MSTYLALGSHTVEAKQEITVMPDWHERMADQLANLGGELLEVYHGNILEYDAAIVFELPSDVPGEQARLLLEDDGTHEFVVSEVFSPAEYDDLVAALE